MKYIYNVHRERSYKYIVQRGNILRNIYFLGETGRQGDLDSWIAQSVPVTINNSLKADLGMVVIVVSGKMHLCHGVWLQQQ